MLCVIIIGTLIVKFRNRRKRKLLRASAAGADRHGDDLNVTYHASPLLNEGDYDDESLEVIKYDTNPRIDGDRLQLMVEEDDDDVTSKR